jgi:tRNA1(Val) A37 N6-methylase TrmN6
MRKTEHKARREPVKSGKLPHRAARERKWARTGVAVKEILRTNDVVYVSWITSLLADSGIEAVQLDTHMSVLEGSISAIPRRLMVADDDYAEAAELVAHAESERVSGTRPDFLLDGQLVLHQPAKGYRAAIDPVLLAAAVPEKPSGPVLDLGCGVGTAALCYAHRVTSAEVVGLEKQADLAGLAERNVRENGFEDRVRIFEGDLLDPPDALAPGGFSHVMANPPYVTAEAADPGMDAARRPSHVEGAAKLADWIACAERMLAHKGALTVVYDAGRLDNLIACLRRGFGGVIVFPLWPVPIPQMGGRDAKRVLVQARKGVRTPARMAAGLVLHEADGGYTRAADDILRGTGALAL